MWAWGSLVGPGQQPGPCEAHLGSPPSFLDLPYSLCKKPHDDGGQVQGASAVYTSPLVKPHKSPRQEGVPGPSFDGRGQGPSEGSARLTLSRDHLAVQKLHLARTAEFSGGAASLEDNCELRGHVFSSQPLGLSLT